MLTTLQLSMIPIILSATLSLFISFSKYCQFETTLASINNIDSKYTFIISRLRHKERCILKNKDIHKIIIDKILSKFDKDTFDAYVEQVLNETDSNFKNIAMKEINASDILHRQYVDRTVLDFNDVLKEISIKKKKPRLTRILNYLYTCRIFNTKVIYKNEGPQNAIIQIPDKNVKIISKIIS